MLHKLKYSNPQTPKKKTPPFQHSAVSVTAVNQNNIIILCIFREASLLPHQHACMNITYSLTPQDLSDVCIHSKKSTGRRRKTKTKQNLMRKKIYF